MSKNKRPYQKSRPRSQSTSASIAPSHTSLQDSPAAVQTTPVPPQQLQRATVIAEEYSGPLPHPLILRQFDDIVPGSAQTIVDEFAAQSRHRRALEDHVIRSDVVMQRWGFAVGALIGILGICGGFMLAWFGRLGGLWLSGGALVALAAVYLAGVRSQRLERIAKDRENP